MPVDSFRGRDAEFLRSAGMERSTPARSAALARWADERMPRLATIARLAAAAHDQADHRVEGELL